MRMLFDADLSVERLIPALSIESGTRITPEDTLVIFDEVQEVPRAMTSLKMFNEAAPEYEGVRMFFWTVRRPVQDFCGIARGSSSPVTS